MISDLSATTPRRSRRRSKAAGSTLGLTEFLGLEKKRREVLGEVEALKNNRNTVSQEISRLKKSGGAADELIAEMRAVGDRISEFDSQIKEIETALSDIIMNIPNIPHESVPVGADETANPEVRRWGTPGGFRQGAAASLGNRRKARHPGLRTRRQGNRGPLHLLSRPGLPPGALAHQLHARPPYRRARLHRVFPALHRQQGKHDRHRPAAEIRPGHVQARGAGVLPDPHRRSAGDQPAPPGDPGRARTCPSYTPLTAPASGPKPEPPAATPAA